MATGDGASRDITRLNDFAQRPPVIGDEDLTLASAQDSKLPGFAKDLSPSPGQIPAEFPTPVITGTESSAREDESPKIGISREELANLSYISTLTPAPLIW